MRTILSLGQARFGKDVLSNRIHEKLGGDWERTAFANNVKKVFCDTFAVDTDFIEEWKVKPDLPSGFLKAVRPSLQFIGDGFREIYPTIWMDLVFRQNKKIIISDGRYRNEFLRSKREDGINILIGRPDKINDDPNPSESEIKPYVEWCLSTYASLIKFVDLRGVNYE